MLVLFSRTFGCCSKCAVQSNFPKESVTQICKFGTVYKGMVSNVRLLNPELFSVLSFAWCHRTRHCFFFFPHFCTTIVLHSELLFRFALFRSDTNLLVLLRALSSMSITSLPFFTTLFIRLRKQKQPLLLLTWPNCAV